MNETSILAVLTAHTLTESTRLNIQKDNSF